MKIRNIKLKYGKNQYTWRIKVNELMKKWKTCLYMYVCMYVCIWNASGESRKACLCLCPLPAPPTDANHTGIIRQPDSGCKYGGDLGLCVWRHREERLLFYAVINNADYRGRVAQVTATYIVGGTHTRAQTYTLHLNVKWKCVQLPLAVCISIQMVCMYAAHTYLCISSWSSALNLTLALNRR